MRTLMSALLFVSLLFTATASADDNPLTAHNKRMYSGIKRILLRTAELMPEEKYGFKPADSVRTFGEVLNHAAGSQAYFCAAVLGEKNPPPKIDKTKTSKADVTAALTEAFSYCDKAYDGLTDATATEQVKFMGDTMPKLGVLNVNSLHSIEHYGNLIVYLRMNNLVPPTSDKEFMSKSK
jgi:uncharacterized damage-inducible protein DinB